EVGDGLVAREEVGHPPIRLLWIGGGKDAGLADVVRAASDGGDPFRSARLDATEDHDLSAGVGSCAALDLRTMKSGGSTTIRRRSPTRPLSRSSNSWIAIVPYLSAS